MKSKITTIAFCTLALSFFALNVSAQGNSNRATTTGNATSSVKTEVRGSASSTENGGRGEEMRSDVAKAVQRLLQVADRNGGLGEEVRKIAREQASSTEAVEEAKERVEKRNALKTFLVGTDYKNLGAIRSEIVKTQSRIKRLQDEASKMIDWDKNLIEDEIDVLESDLQKLEQFIKDNEGRFSLFGWAIRLFQ